MARQIGVDLIRDDLGGYSHTSAEVEVPWTRRATCRLCGQPAKLIHSHLLSKALYRLIREPTLRNPNPFLVTRGGAVQTSTQLEQHLLCTVCEDRFNKNGESWVLKYCVFSARVRDAISVALLS